MQWSRFHCCGRHGIACGRHGIACGRHGLWPSWYSLWPSWFVAVMVQALRNDVSYLTHLCDGVIKHTASVISSLTYQLHFPRSSRQTQLGGAQFYHLLANLCEDRPTFLPTVNTQVSILASLTATLKDTRIKERKVWR